MESTSSDGDRPSLHEEPATSATTNRRTIDLDSPAAARSPGPIVRLLGTLVLVAGLILGLSGVGTWAMVQTSLADERIIVADDAERFAGQDVNGPFTAYYEADIIQKHTLESSGGKTYAELDREDPARASVMNGSFLRASLFTSVVSFGVAAMAMGLGIVFVLIGFALRSIGKQLP